MEPRSDEKERGSCRFWEDCKRKMWTNCKEWTAHGREGLISGGKAHILEMFKNERFGNGPFREVCNGCFGGQPGCTDRRALRQPGAVLGSFLFALRKIQADDDGNGDPALPGQARPGRHGGGHRGAAQDHQVAHLHVGAGPDAAGLPARQPRGQRPPRHPPEAVRRGRAGRARGQARAGGVPARAAGRL